ncbi:hypothetical protein PSPO01_03699 [Paraphaeosphaeria sporulosa]
MGAPAAIYMLHHVPCECLPDDRMQLPTHRPTPYTAEPLPRNALPPPLRSKPTAQATPTQNSLLDLIATASPTHQSDSRSPPLSATGTQ